MALLREAKAVGTRKQRKDLLISTEQASLRSPSNDNPPRCGSTSQNALVISRADGIIYPKQAEGIRRPKSEEVDEL
jgi:hypothetical protein